MKLFPAQELKRGGARKKPRDWKKRWQDAGGKLVEGRMVALVDDPIWARISRWGDPLPPFDYNSGMKLFKVSRANAIRLGLLPKPESSARKAKPESGEKRPVPAPEKPKASDVAKAKLERAREAIFGVPAPVEPPLAPAIKANAQIVAKAVGVKLGAPMTFEQGDGNNVNPNYAKARRFRDNCQTCVVAYEMRRRGLDVQARGSGDSPHQSDLEEGTQFAWKYATKKRLKSYGKLGHLKALDDATREKGRYFVEVKWEFGAHVFCAERTQDGALKLYDPQNASVGDSSSGIFGDRGNYFDDIAKNGISVLRVDDREADVRVVSGVVKRNKP